MQYNNNIVYVLVLEEATNVFRPVPAIKIRRNIYKLEGFDIYNPSDETWEFKPGTIVLAEMKELEGEKVLVAIKMVMK